ncbi:type IV secretion system protein VirB9 [Mesorhizobium albiziae]|uniref:Type IV secretion system protein VirB9 n=1 Tax=Neomesorhizobium albiziae TaxID=335020 RepID=A0A1I4EVB9_9HYPH|nr:P-type conjugative transfer protein TrbG [Mesorhizobium albiziae]GLS33459.1 P-type conjugative transfer protein TrbG [Mesorhizobium albiziae]SFL09624.1 type IV secretion system protein VirB9 [Mesorhizobium albiziae]
MTFRSVFALSMSAIALAGCAGKKTPPPNIAYDSGNFQAAAIEPEPAKPVEVVTVAKPLPLPGQLQPPPATEKQKNKKPPTARVEAANNAALQEPVEQGYINAVQVYPFTEGALYRLYAAPEQVSDIALQPGETLTSVSAGDTVRWVIGDTTSGSSDQRRVHVLVKPFASGLKTNLVITTDRRSYHLLLESTDRTAMAAISWTYPQDRLVAIKRRNETAEAAAPVASGVSLENLRFRYAISGDNPPWRPKRAFDDGSKVYVEFPRSIDQGEAPPLFVVGPDGSNQLVNYRVRNNYYIVDRLFAAAELRLGTKPQQIVRISRTDMVASNRRRPFGGLFRRSDR